MSVLFYTCFNSVEKMNQEEPPGALTLIRLLSESRRTAPVQSKAVLGVRIHQKLHKSNIDT